MNCVNLVCILIKVNQLEKDTWENHETLNMDWLLDDTKK